MQILRNIKFLVMLILLSAPTAIVIAQTIDFQTFGYGPYDYTDPEDYRNHLPVVEKNHFNSDVENLRATMHGSQYLGAHLLYTIAAFPNHHRALVSTTRLWERSGSAIRPPPGVARNQTPDFLYRRALDFAPTDGVVRLLYGIYLIDAGREDEGVVLLDEAARLGPDNAEMNFNLGLMYLRVNATEKADLHASKAYEQGHPLPGLRNKMISAGLWSE